MEEDRRLIKMLKNIHISYLGADYSVKKKVGAPVTAAMVPGVSSCYA
jgi:hypothetical protein